MKSSWKNFNKTVSDRCWGFIEFFTAVALLAGSFICFGFKTDDKSIPIMLLIMGIASLAASIYFFVQFAKQRKEENKNFQIGFEDKLKHNNEETSENYFKTPFDKNAFTNADSKEDLN